MNARPQPSGLRVNLKDVLLLVPAADPRMRVADYDLQLAVRHEIFYWQEPTCAASFGHV